MLILLLFLRYPGYLTLMRVEQGRRSTLIFCQSIRAVDALQSEFDDRHIPAASVTGKNRFQDRLAILKKFNEGSIEGSSTAAP